MKAKEMITYIKNGEEIQKTINFWNRTPIVLSIFEHPFSQQNNWDYYKIKDDVTFLHLKNVIFYRDVKFRCSKDTLLILENCKFRGTKVTFIEGNIQVINPDLSCAYYRNNIIGQDLEDFSLDSKTNSPTYLSLSIYSKNIKIDGEKRIDRIHLMGEKIEVQNISQLNSLYIQGKEVKIANSNLKIFDKDLQEGIDKKTGPCITCHTLELERTTLNSCYTLEVKCKKMITDTQSDLISNYEVIIGNDIYKNKKAPNTLLIVPTNYLLAKPQKDISRKEWISILKGVQKLAELEIKKSARKKEKRLLAESDTLKVIPNQVKNNQRVKQYEQGMYQHRKIKTYQKFQ